MEEAEVHSDPDHPKLVKARKKFEVAMRERQAEEATSPAVEKAMKAFRKRKAEIEVEPIVGAVIDGMTGEELEAYIEATAKSKPLVRELQSKVDAVPAKTGRPRKHTPEERKAMRAELMRKKRAAAKEGK